MTELRKKVCLLGEFAVGKTSLIRRFVHHKFDDRYLSTIGVKVSSKKIVVPQNDVLFDLTMMLWDLAGTEEFTRMRGNYLRGSFGAVLVCDLTRKNTLSELNKYIYDLRNISPDVKLVLAANKVDRISDHQITVQEVKEFATQISAPFYLTSAKEGDDVDELFRHLGQMLI